MSCVTYISAKILGEDLLKNAKMPLHESDIREADVETRSNTSIQD